MSADSKEEFFESCLHEVLNNLRTKVFNCALKRELRCALRHLFEGKEFGKSLVFQLLVLMLEVKNKRHGGAGYVSIIVVSPLQSIIHDQVLEVNSMGMSASALCTGQQKP